MYWSKAHVTLSRGRQAARDTDKLGFVHPSDAGQQHRPSLLEAIYSEKAAAYASPSLCIVSVMFLDNGAIGCLAGVCFCVGSVSCLKFCSACRALTAQLLFTENPLVGDQCFWAVVLSLFWYCLMLQILTSWVFIVLCGSLVYCFHPRWTRAPSSHSAQIFWKLLEKC